MQSFSVSSDGGTPMKPAIPCALGVSAFAFFSASLGLAQKVGSAAPNFHARDSMGQTQSLDQYRGKFVVLEWTNRDCPYTKKQYSSGNMQKLQKEWSAKGVVWLTVLSSAKGQQGYLTATQENAWIKTVGADPHAAILDPSELARPLV
jgi:hypothetical protein